MAYGLPNVMAENTTGILILPFDIRTDQNHSFLKPAILDMLYTRLTAPGRSITADDRVLSPEATPSKPMTTQDAIDYAQQKDAEYAVLGRVTLLGDTIGTEITFIGIAEQRVLIAFSQTGEREGDIITHIDSFSAQVNTDIFGPGKSLETKPTPTETSDDVHQHPEKLVIPETPSDTPAENEAIDKKEPLPKRPNVNSR
jgi:hypothetical protein